MLISGTGSTGKATEPERLRAWLKTQGHEAVLLEKALLNKAAVDARKSLYDRNRAVYGPP